MGTHTRGSLQGTVTRQQDKEWQKRMWALIVCFQKLSPMPALLMGGCLKLEQQRRRQQQQQQQQQQHR